MIDKRPSSVNFLNPAALVVFCAAVRVRGEKLTDGGTASVNRYTSDASEARD